MDTWLAAASLIGSAVLVGITWWYAYQTREMVREMRQSRRDAIRPHIRLDTQAVTNRGLTRVENVGTGPAINLDIRLDSNSDGPVGQEQYQWHAPILRPGESRLLHFPTQGVRDLISMEQLRRDRFRIQLEGSCLDLEGARHAVSGVLELDQNTNTDIWVHGSREVETSAKRIADELERIREALPG